ncbi:hypothetical protein GCM10017620_24900 [Brevundimonas intermedia]|uniref:Helix-turn-helix domain-containing protein n=1 Tax=Brevundimonas intermedia TaxID=74315 RepID=A0ABQ5TAU0_9CAUL|nr:helix-turn-helix domain-containing protein [Brevundimonas intermedia]GLK49517.1 hypothetical protein GCM10017620_24900 [Brevundimonas intermedia]
MNTSPANDATALIGPATERRIQMAFADTCLLTAGATAKLLGIDEKSLRALADEGVIRAVRKGGGRSRAFTEGDVRAYLTQGAAPTRSMKVRPTGNSQVKVVPFSQRASLARR